MAFDKKDGFSYLDNIPFKISSAFLPPPSVILPTVLNTDGEFPFEKFQYDFSKEKEVLKDIENKKHAELEHESFLNSEANYPKLQNPGFNSSAKTNVQNKFSLQSDILLPNTQKPPDKISNIDKQNNSKINLSDFENDTSSPFDYMELQTINDLEELSNVFQGLNNKYSSDHNVYKDNKNSISDNLNENNSGSNVSKSMSFPNENSENFLPCPKEKDGHQNTWNASLPTENSFYPVPHTSELGFENQSQSLERTLFFSTTPKVPCFSFPSARNDGVIGNGLPLNSSTLKSALRGCKSYSDIHQLSEQCSTDDSVKTLRSSTPPSAAFSTVTEAAPSPPLISKKDKISSGDANCDNSSTLSGFPDPYNELTEEEQRFVDAIADMGFTRAQVSRSVKHLGSDEKRVVEHLCQIQTLEESGYDCLEAEAALHLHDYNQDQAKQFLDLINKFQDLGFEKNAVKKALIQNKNDYDKTIDALLS